MRKTHRNLLFALEDTFRRGLGLGTYDALSKVNQTSNKIRSPVWAAGYPLRAATFANLKSKEDEDETDLPNS